jgi:hypothetical protein
MVGLKSRTPRLYACPTNFPELRDNFGTLFETWLAVRDKYGPGVYNYLGTRRGMQLYTENQFIMLVSGLESFHRAKYADEPKSRSASAKLHKIVDQIAGKKDKEWVEKGLAYKILPNLARRIFDTLNALPLGFDQK